MNIQLLSLVFSSFPKVIQAVQEIMASDAAHTVETAFKEWFDHNTKGAPNSPALNGN
jgi:hypothetical protein